MTDVEEQLRLDKLIYGSCFWHVVDGRKVRVDPRDVTIDQKGRIISCDDGSLIIEGDV